MLFFHFYLRIQQCTKSAATETVLERERLFIPALSHEDQAMGRKRQRGYSRGQDWSLVRSGAGVRWGAGWYFSHVGQATYSTVV